MVLSTYVSVDLSQFCFHHFVTTTSCRCHFHPCHCHHWWYGICIHPGYQMPNGKSQMLKTIWPTNAQDQDLKQHSKCLPLVLAKMSTAESSSGKCHHCHSFPNAQCSLVENCLSLWNGFDTGCHPCGWFCSLHFVHFLHPRPLSHNGVGSILETCQWRRHRTTLAKKSLPGMCLQWGSSCELSSSNRITCVSI